MTSDDAQMVRTNLSGDHFPEMSSLLKKKSENKRQHL